jgi:hypothetical protein
MHKSCATPVGRPDSNSANISEFSLSNSIHIGPLCSVAREKKKIAIWPLNINEILIKAKYEVKQRGIITRFLIPRSMALLDQVATHPLVDPTKSRIPTPDR